MNDALREAVKKLFEEKKVKSVIGYRQHPLSGEVVPAIIRSADQADQLIFDKRCVYNLTRGNCDITWAMHSSSRDRSMRRLSNIKR